VLHLLTYDLGEKRKEYARAMLPFSHAAECDGWHHFVTDDERWFFLNTSSRRMWTLSKENVDIKLGLDIQRRNAHF
jgi:hypothetical protein